MERRKELGMMGMGLECWDDEDGGGGWMIGVGERGQDSKNGFWGLGRGGSVGSEEKGDRGRDEDKR